MRWRRIGRAGAKWACSALAVLVAAAIVASTWGTLETTLFGPAPPGDIYPPVRLMADIKPGTLYVMMYSPPSTDYPGREGLTVWRHRASRAWSLAPSISRRNQLTLVTVPLWIPLCALAAPAGLLWYPDARAARRRRTGVCRSCGYDRRGLGAEATCPECGAAGIPNR